MLVPGQAPRCDTMLLAMIPAPASEIANQLATPKPALRLLRRVGALVAFLTSWLFLEIALYNAANIENPGSCLTSVENVRMLGPLSLLVLAWLATKAPYWLGIVAGGFIAIEGALAASSPWATDESRMFIATVLSIGLIIIALLTTHQIRVVRTRNAKRW